MHIQVIWVYNLDHKNLSIILYMKKKQILIINTGGTISCIQSSTGFAPQAGFVKQALQNMPELQHPQMPHYQLIEYTNLIDSSNITLDDWNTIASDIAKHYNQFDGFIILHGTDTLAYTSSALSFMLENIAKPVIITGAQIPLSELRSDGKENIITSLYLAQSEELHEVCVFFNQKLLRGNRAQKVSAYEFSAFDSPNLPPLAIAGVQIKWQDNLRLDKPSKPFNLQLLQQHYIANFRLFPSFSTNVLKHLLTQPLKGLVLETYGSGNAQDNDPEFIKILNDASKREVIIINCSQCHHGKVNMSTYATGNMLQKAGVISAYNMTAEAAHCKLLYLLSKNLTPPEIKHAFNQPICGEYSS